MPKPSHALGRGRRLLEYRRAQAAFNVLGRSDPDEERGADLFFKAEAAAERLGKLVAAIAPADFA
ncbi:TPA: hypothetical protein ACRN02_006793 [Pseudomonas aeruginosa]